MRLRDFVVLATVKTVDAAGKITGEHVEEVPFLALSDRAKIQAICETLNIPCAEPPPTANKHRNVPSLFVGKRRLLFNEEHQIKNIIDYEHKPPPKWADEAWMGGLGC